MREYAERLPNEFDGIPSRYGEMPYRKLLWFMEARLELKRLNGEGGYGLPEEFRADLELIAKSLENNSGTVAGLDLVRRVLWRVDVFGFHLAALDVRQDAEVHRRVAGELLGDTEFSTRPPSERVQRIAKALQETGPSAGEPLAAADDNEVTRTLDVFRALAEAREAARGHQQRPPLDAELPHAVLQPDRHSGPAQAHAERGDEHA